MERPDPAVVLVRDDEEVAAWPLAWRGRADMAVVDGLARLVLAARRMGCSVRLRHAPAELAGLLDLAGLAGLAGVVAPAAGGGRSGLEAVGKPEGAEQGGVQEVVVPDDTLA